MKNEEKEINPVIKKEIIEEQNEKKENIPISFIKTEPKIINEKIKLDDFDEINFYNVNNINSFRTGYNKENNTQNENNIINDDNDDFLTENLLNAVNDSKNKEKQNTSSSEDDSDEINTNKSNLERKRKKQFQKNNYYMNTDFSYNRNQPIKIMSKSHRNDESDLKDTLALFAKADKLKKESAKIKLKTKEKSFWDKLFSPFQCGSTNNN